jgi:hypothetical protein
MYHASPGTVDRPCICVPARKLEMATPTSQPNTPSQPRCYQCQPNHHELLEEHTYRRYNSDLVGTSSARTHLPNGTDHLHRSQSCQERMTRECIYTRSRRHTAHFAKRCVDSNEAEPSRKARIQEASASTISKA